MLVEASADPRAVNDQGKRPDEVAAEEGWEEIAQWLRHDPLALAGDIPESSTGREGSTSSTPSSSDTDTTGEVHSRNPA